MLLLLPHSPPVPVGVDSSGQSIPGEVPKLFGGDVVEYLKATGCEIPLIVSSCIRAIDKEGLCVCVFVSECVFVEVEGFTLERMLALTLFLIWSYLVHS